MKKIIGIMVTVGLALVMALSFNLNTGSNENNNLASFISMNIANASGESSSPTAETGDLVTQNCTYLKLISVSQGVNPETGETYTIYHYEPRNGTKKICVGDTTNCSKVACG